MPIKRFLPWAAALTFISTPALAQTNPEPDALPATSEPETPETPEGTPEPVEPTPEATPAPEPVSAPAPEATPTKVVVEQEVEIVKVDKSGRVGSAWNREQSEKEGKQYLWYIDIGGYVRAGYRGIQNDPSGTFGAHDGFALGNARLSLTGRMRSLGFKLQLDGAVDRNDDANDPNAEVVTRLKDANAFWQPLDAVRLTVGQFKPPHDVEEVLSTTDILFVDRSVASRGVKNVEGPNVAGLSVDREVGVQLGTAHWHPFAEDNARELVGFSYGLALTNGQTANTALNDNDKLAFYGRAAVHWADMVTLGGGYFVNDRTVGVDPDTIDEDTAGWTADLSFTSFGITLLGSAMSQTTSRPDISTDPETTALGYQVSVAYKEPFLGFQPAFRYAYLDPAELADDSDAVTHMTFGLNYRPDYPIAVLVNYTIAQETEDNELPNNRFDAMLQVTW